MARRLTIILVVAVLFAAAGSWWREHRRAERAEADAGLAASRTLSAVFSRTSALEVARLDGEVVTRVEGRSGFGMFANAQTTRAPYSVTYLVDLHALRPGDFRWNTDRRLMIVTIPEVTVGTPRVDLAQARSGQSGIYISRASGLAMGQRVAGNLAAAAAAKAGAPEQLARAQASARDAVAALVRAPLAAAGLGDVSVVVRLAGEERPAGLDHERWDESRPVADVVHP